MGISDGPSATEYGGNRTDILTPKVRDGVDHGLEVNVFAKETKYSPTVTLGMHIYYYVIHAYTHTVQAVILFNVHPTQIE